MAIIAKLIVPVVYIWSLLVSSTGGIRGAALERSLVLPRLLAEGDGLEDLGESRLEL